MDIGNLFDISKIQNFQKEIFESITTFTTSSEIKIERIISKGHYSEYDTWYNQDTEEIVFLLKGKAVIEFENNEIIYLKEGDYVTIPKFVKHKVNETSTEPECIWLAIHYK